MPFNTIFWFYYCWKHCGLSTIYLKHNLFNQSKLGRDVELQNTHIVLFKSPRDSSQQAWRTVKFRLKAISFVSKRNICSLRSFSEWLVAMKWRSITFLYKHRIPSLKILYPGPTETVKIFERWTHKISLLPKCSNHFPANAEPFPSVLRKRVY